MLAARAWHAPRRVPVLTAVPASQLDSRARVPKPFQNSVLHATTPPAHGTSKILRTATSSESGDRIGDVGGRALRVVLVRRSSAQWAPAVFLPTAQRTKWWKRFKAERAASTPLTRSCVHAAARPTPRASRPPAMIPAPLPLHAACAAAAARRQLGLRRRSRGSGGQRAGCLAARAILSRR
eukprot:357233-Chlamydomonas_euryale.AAC.9